MSNLTNDNDKATRGINEIRNDDDMTDRDRKNRNENNEITFVRGLRLEAIFHPKFDNERNKKVTRTKGILAGKEANSSCNIRSAMLKKLLGLASIDHSGSVVEAGKGTGHLEVSLKHSGSLVLWSGSTRYYSKNSACNEFTRTAEILLRQRFEMVREAINSLNGSSIEKCQKHYLSYEDCSIFVTHHRYTIAFEVVAGEILGDHGQIPNFDYVVVTAIADRSQERFLSTTEVIEFCQKFRLPHNDVWTFFPPKSKDASLTDVTSSAETLFEMYDNFLREKGNTENTIQALTDIADLYIPSPIPHSIYQGNICEGFIVRYIDDIDSDFTDVRQRLETLAQAAHLILEEIPPQLLSSQRPIDRSMNETIRNVNLRDIYRSIPFGDHSEERYSPHTQKSSLSIVALQRQRAVLFSNSLLKLLKDWDENEIEGESRFDDSDSERQIKKPRREQKRCDLKKIMLDQEDNGEGDKCISTIEANSSSNRFLSNYHLPTMTKSLVESQDEETKRIANLLQTLDTLKGGAVTYTWMEKPCDELDNSWDFFNKKSRLQQRNRLYCIIHVHNDSTFFKFQKIQYPFGMALFRGFCVEVLLSSSDEMEREPIGVGTVNEEDSCTTSSVLVSEEKKSLTKLSSANSAPGAPLMLKMKLLPYMIRTFICRNLLTIIYEKGLEEFERLALGLLEKWNLSDDAKERWMPFFRGWALYVLQHQAEQDQRKLQIQEQQKSDIKKDVNLSQSNGPSICANPKSDTMLQLGPLTNFSYLRHLEHFTNLYKSGDFVKASPMTSLNSPECHTFVCVVSQSTEVSSALAYHFANHFKLQNSEEEMFVCSLGEAAKNRRSKSCIVYANVGDLTKGIKKFICNKKVAKRSILILFGSDKKEIIDLTIVAADELPVGTTRPLSWLHILSKDEGKKIVKMWKLWKKLPCAKLIEFEQARVSLDPPTEGSDTAIITGVSGTQEIMNTIQGVGKSILQQENKNQSDPSRRSILVFFPGIPGCGKSSLLKSSRTSLEEELVARKEKNEYHYDRRICIEEGDRVGKNFWNIIEGFLSDESLADVQRPALVIADKNVPPASWPKLGQMGHDSRSIMLPVIPDSSVFQTTTIKGSIQPDGTRQSHTSHFYPFSLKFLAISMSRVLSRPPGEHAGKLDSGSAMACMVVVQFFSFYRYIGADTFQEKMNEKFDKIGALSIKFLEPINLPFLTESARKQALPDDLKNLLEEALQLRHGHDIYKQFKVKNGDMQMIDLEGRLRASIKKNIEIIRNMSVDLEDIKEVFVTQIIDRIESLRNELQTTMEPAVIDHSQKIDVSKNIKLVSVDIDENEVHKILHKYKKSGALKMFFDCIESSPLPPGLQSCNEDTTMTTNANANNRSDKGVTADISAPNFIKRTHITMAYAGENNSAETLVSKFGHLQDKKVMISITGFLWSPTNAALAIKISPFTVGKDPISIPRCENSFAHITVWCTPNVKASLSNQLPILVEKGNAFRVDFSEEDLLVGNICFWDHKNEPFKVPTEYGAH